MMQKKGTASDLMILEKLPPKVDLRLLVDRFVHYKQPRKKVFDLVRKGFLELANRGHYLNLRSQDLKQTSLESIANALYFPSYVSAEWALQHYGLLTDRVYTITSVTPKKSTYFNTSLGNFEFKHLHKHRYPFGYQVHPDYGFIIARPEKALLDYLKLRDHDITWHSSNKMEKFFNKHLRVHLSLLLQQTTGDNIRELLPHYHRNSKEARILKWLLTEVTKKESNNGQSD